MSDFINCGLSTWDSMVETAERRERGDQQPLAQDASMSGEFDGCGGKGTATLGEAIKLCKMGWQAGAELLARALDALPAGEEVLPDWQMDVAGAFPCVPAFIAGDPECVWHRQENRRIERRVLIAPPISYPAVIKDTQAMVYAKAVAAVVRAVEASGIQPAIYGICKNKPVLPVGMHNDIIMHAVCVRAFGDPLDLAKVAFSLHPSMLRRIHFAWRETHPVAAPIIGRNGYGSAQAHTVEDVRALLGDDIGCPIAVLPPLYEMARELTDSNLSNVINKFRGIVQAACEAAT